MLAAGLFAAGYSLMGFWLDLGRVDSLFLALLLAAYWLTFVRTARIELFGIAAGLALWMSYATKQTGAIAFPFLCLYLILEKRWARLISFGLSFSTFLVAWVVVANTLSNGWFYTFLIPRSFPIWPALFANTWNVYLLPNLYPVLALMGLAAVDAGLKRGWHRLKRYSLLVGCLAVPLLIMTHITMSTPGGYVNGLMPALAGFALAGAEAAH
jgi:hypothetical protein